jgi:hypothetical protein
LTQGFANDPSRRAAQPLSGFPRPFRREARTPGVAQPELRGHPRRFIVAAAAWASGGPTTGVHALPATSAVFVSRDQPRDPAGPQRAHARDPCGPFLAGAAAVPTGTARHFALSHFASVPLWWRRAPGAKQESHTTGAAHTASTATQATNQPTRGRPRAPPSDLFPGLAAPRKPLCCPHGLACPLRVPFVSLNTCPPPGRSPSGPFPVVWRRATQPRCHRIAAAVRPRPVTNRARMAVVFPPRGAAPWRGFSLSSPKTLGPTRIDHPAACLTARWGLKDWVQTAPKGQAKG